MPRALKACGTCGTPTVTTPCPDCTPTRPSGQHRRTAAERGNTRRWRKLRDEAVRRQPWCAWPGGCHHPITDANPLTGDHLVPRSVAPELMYEPTNVIVLCKKHNSVKGTRTMGPGWTLAAE